MKMRVLLHKISDERHALEIVREDGRRERVDCETRSYLQHDLLHYAAETEASLSGGFWGSLARGRTLAEMNDRTPIEGTSEMMVIEKVVGALSGMMKGQTPEQQKKDEAAMTKLYETILREQRDLKQSLVAASPEQKSRLDQVAKDIEAKKAKLRSMQDIYRKMYGKDYDPAKD